MYCFHFVLNPVILFCLKVALTRILWNLDDHLNKREKKKKKEGT